MSSNRTFSGGRNGAGGGIGSASVVVTPNTGLSGNGTSVNPLAGVPASALVPGTMSVADFVKLATVPAGITGLMVAGVTPSFNFLATGTHVLSLPTLAGKSFCASVSRVIIDSRTGVATGNLVGKVGNNVAHDNVVAAGTTLLTAAGANIALPNIPGWIAGTNFVGVVDMTTTPISVEITGALGGAAVLTGRIIVFGVYL